MAAEAPTVQLVLLMAVVVVVEAEERLAKLQIVGEEVVERCGQEDLVGGAEAAVQILAVQVHCWHSLSKSSAAVAVELEEQLQTEASGVAALHLEPQVVPVVLVQIEAEAVLWQLVLRVVVRPVHH